MDALAALAGPPAADAGAGEPFGGPPVRVVAAADLTYDAFVLDHLAPGIPVLVTGVTASWPAAAALVGPGGTPDPAALAALAPGARAPVAHCGGDPGPSSMTLAEYAGYWGAHASGRDSRLLYLKDFHLARSLPRGATLYAVPPCFADDWLNGACDAGLLGGGEGRDGGGGDDAPPSSTPPPDDYRFLYLGPAGTHTRLHADVLGSASWSASVAGVKRWALAPPRVAPLLHDTFGRDLAPGFEGVDDPRFPGLAAAAAAATRLDQPPGSALFVPPGWHHTVLNLTSSLSINHNWVNAHTLPWTVGGLARERAGAAAAIDDCRWEGRDERGGSALPSSLNTAAQYAWGPRPPSVAGAPHFRGQQRNRGGARGARGARAAGATPPRAARARPPAQRAPAGARAARPARSDKRGAPSHAGGRGLTDRPHYTWGHRDRAPMDAGPTPTSPHRAGATGAEFEALVRRNVRASAGADAGGLCRLLAWGAGKAETNADAAVDEGGALGAALDAARVAAAAAAVLADASQPAGRPGGDGAGDEVATVAARDALAAAARAARAAAAALVRVRGGARES